MEIPGWVFVLVGSIVAAISFIIYANTGTFQFFILVGGVFFLYGLGKMAVSKMREKNERKLNSELMKYSKPTTFKDLPIGKEYYSRQLGAHSHAHPQAAYQGHPQAHQQHPQGHSAHGHSRQTHAGHSIQHAGAHPGGHFRQAHDPARHAAYAGQAHQRSHSPYSYCSRCGARNGHVNFCGNCGGRLR